MKLDDKEILTKITKFLFPFIIAFGLYVITHGELGPGGGFQGGVIIAAAYILYALVYGLDEARKLLPRKVVDFLCPVGVLIYAGTALSTLLLGGHFLEFNLLRPSDPPAGQSLGLTLIESGVAITVSMTMISLFSEMAERPE